MSRPQWTLCEAAGWGAEPKNTPQGRARAQHWPRTRGSPWAVHTHVHRAGPTRSRGLHSSPLMSPPTSTRTSQPRPKSWAHGARACLTTAFLTHSQLHTLEPPCSLPVVLGKGRRVNPILEMREQRLGVGVRRCFRRNYGRRHPELGGLHLHGPGALDEGCMEPPPPLCPSPATQCPWRMHEDVPAVVCVPSGGSHIPALPAHTNLGPPEWLPRHFLTPPFAPALGLDTFPHLAGLWRLGCLSLTSCETLSLSPTPTHLTPIHTGTGVGRCCPV